MNECVRKASDFAQAARSHVGTYQRTNQEENVTSEKLKRFSKWPLFWFVLMWVSGLVPVLCALLSR